MQDSKAIIGEEEKTGGTPCRPLDALVISDLHLGSPICRDRQLLAFLEGVVDGTYRTQQLILNGDVFDSIDFRRLNKRHWKILSLLRKLSDHMRITWVCGNHDGPSEPVSHLLGVDVREEYSFRSGERKVLILHGHTFDNFIDTYPRITLFADLIYRLLQRIDPSHRFARYAKSNSKVFLRCVEKIRRDAMSYARLQEHDVVCCGHTHHAEAGREDGVAYFNSGSWTESPCTFLAIEGGRVDVCRFELEPARSDSPSVRELIPVPSFS